MNARALIATGLALPLAACLSFGEKPPPSLMTLTAAATMPAGTQRTARDGTAVTVVPPSGPQELSVLRVPVHSGASIAYLKGAQWVDAPGRLFRELLAETIAARTSHPVIDIRQFALAPGIRLAGRLENFGIDAGSMSAVVTYDATLSRPNVDAVETRRFEARVPIGAVEPAPVSDGLNRAANQVATEVADWIGG